MTSNLEKLEKLLAEETRPNHLSYRSIKLYTALRNSAPLLLEIVKKVKQYKELAPVDTEGLALQQLFQSYEKFEESK